MKKSELNNYGITNPDGFGEKLDTKKTTFDNDDPKYIKENSSLGQKETTRVAETFDDPITIAEEQTEERINMELSSEASSAMASASASVGGSIGALAGVVAASVVAAVVVAAVFISTLAINLSLVMAEMNRLVLQVDIHGAQSEDFETPIYAVLTSEDGTYMEQEIGIDTLTIHFDNLQPGTEYRVKVKNTDKVFSDKIFFTSTENINKGEIVSRIEGNTDVYVSVNNAELKSTEYYTIVAKNSQGNIVFTKDGIEPFTEYHFTINEPQDLYFFLVVNGVTYATSEIKPPEYDFKNGIWTWAEDKLSATVTFADKRGGESLVLDASITRKTTDPTCEKDGSIVYTAKATYEGKTYTKKETTVIDSLGHNYEGVFEDNHITYTCSRCGHCYTDE